MPQCLKHGTRWTDDDLRDEQFGCPKCEDDNQEFPLLDNEEDDEDEFDDDDYDDEDVWDEDDEDLDDEED